MLDALSFQPANVMYLFSQSWLNVAWVSKQTPNIVSLFCSDMSYKIQLKIIIAIARSYSHNVSSCSQCSTNWAIMPAGSWPGCEFVIYLKMSNTTSEYVKDHIFWTAQREMKTFSAENLSYWVSLKYCVFWKNAEVFYQTNIFQDVLSKSSLLINFVQLQVPGLRFVLIGHEFTS